MHNLQFLLKKCFCSDPEEDTKEEIEEIHKIHEHPKQEACESLRVEIVNIGENSFIPEILPELSFKAIAIKKPKKKRVKQQKSEEVKEKVLAPEPKPVQEVPASPEKKPLKGILKKPRKFF